MAPPWTGVIIRSPRPCRLQDPPWCSLRSVPLLGRFLVVGAKRLMLSRNKVSMEPGVVIHGHGIRLEPALIEKLYIVGNTVIGGQTGIFFAESMVTLGLVTRNTLIGNKTGLSLSGLQARTHLRVIANRIRESEENGMVVFNPQGAAPRDVVAGKEPSSPPEICRRDLAVVGADDDDDDDQDDKKRDS